MTGSWTHDHSIKSSTWPVAPLCHPVSPVTPAWQWCPAPDPLCHYATRVHLSHLCGSDVQRVTRCATMPPGLSHQRGSDVQHLTRCATMPPRFTCHTRVGVTSSTWPVVPLCHPVSPVTLSTCGSTSMTAISPSLWIWRTVSSFVPYSAPSYEPYSRYACIAMSASIESYVTNM